MALSLAEKDRKVFHIAVQLLCGDASYTILKAGRDLEDIPLASLVKSRWSTFLSCLEEPLASHEPTPANDVWDSIPESFSSVGNQLWAEAKRDPTEANFTRLDRSGVEAPAAPPPATATPAPTTASGAAPRTSQQSQPSAPLQSPARATRQSIQIPPVVSGKRDRRASTRLNGYVSESDHEQSSKRQNTGKCKAKERPAARPSSATGYLCMSDSEESEIDLSPRKASATKKWPISQAKTSSFKKFLSSHSKAQCQATRAAKAQKANISEGREAQPAPSQFPLPNTKARTANQDEQRHLHAALAGKPAEGAASSSDEFDDDLDDSMDDYRVPKHPLTVRPERASKETSLTLARLRVSSERTAEQNKGQSQIFFNLSSALLAAPPLRPDLRLPPLSLCKPAGNATSGLPPVHPSKFYEPSGVHPDIRSVARQAQAEEGAALQPPRHQQSAPIYQPGAGSSEVGVTLKRLDVDEDDVP
ncbi:hypothetical protein V8E36_005885 [Tilletia maclaganii]